MKQQIELGSSPSDEPCFQVGDEDYEHNARMECGVYVDLIRRCYRAAHGDNDLPKGLKLRIKGNSHDFGTYYEVIATFFDDDAAAVTAAFWLDENAPRTWDEESRARLGSLCTVVPT